MGATRSKSGLNSGLWDETRGGYRARTGTHVELGFLLAYPLLHVPLTILELLAERGLRARQQRVVGVHSPAGQVHAVRVVARHWLAPWKDAGAARGSDEGIVVVVAAAGAHLRAAVGARRHRRRALAHGSRARAPHSVVVRRMFTRTRLSNGQIIQNGSANCRI